MPEIDDELNNLNRAIKETIDLLRKLKQESIAARGGIVSDEELRQNEKLNQLLRERTAISKETPVERAQRRLSTGGANAPGATSRATVDPSQMGPAVRTAAEKDYQATQKMIASLDKERAARDRAAKAAEKLAAEEKRLADARGQVANNPRYRQALEQAERLGMGVQNLRSIEDRGGGIQQLSFSKTEGGIDTKFKTYVSETGKATAALSSQFRSFGKDIIRDIGQFTKWSIAIAAVYTPLQKLGELMTIMIDNESRLADATIAANLPFSKSGEIFDTVAVSANKAGESINTTIDAYTSAIRAAGRYTDEGTKQAAAIKLTNDALILSKLSTLDQADAIDVLSAALLQSDRSLAGGTDLLNKWVRVSQIANVDITALATGVAVLGDSAETVGLSIDQLNGLIAVLSEQSISGAKEAANTAKALVGAYQSDKAEAALTKYGVALRRANGEVRGFLEIYQELARLRQQGILSEAAVSEVALALGGGGVRRAKDASALINSTERLNVIAKESASITGEDTLAQDALSKKLQTVQTANTRLANSFQELAQVLGTDGGLLDDFKVLINLLTGVTKGATELFSLLGRSGPLLATFSTGLLALTSMSSSRKDVMLAGLGGQFFRGGQFMPGGGRAPAGGSYIGTNLGTQALGDILRMNYRGAGILGGLGVAAQAGTNLSAGRNENALANVAGGVIGGAIGAALGGPIGLAAGANIGSAIGDAFVTGVEKHSDQLADYFIPKRRTDIPEQQGTETYRGKNTQELLDTAYNSLNFIQKIQAYLNFREARPNAQGQYEKYQTKESAAIDMLKTINPALYTELKRQYTAQQAALAPQATLAGINNNQQYAQERALREQQATQARREQLQRLASGQITTAEYGRITNQISGFPAQSIQSVEAYGEAFERVSKDVNSTEDAYKAFLYIATNGTQEQINLLSQYSNDINTLQALLASFSDTTIGTKLQLSFGDVTIESKDQLQKLVAELQSQAGTAATATYTQLKLNQLKLPGIVGSATEPTSAPDIQLIKQQAEKLQQQFYTDMNLTEDEITNLRSKLENFSVLVGDAADNHYKTITGIDQKFWDAAQKLLVEQGKIQDQNKGIGFQKFDIPMAQLQMLAGQSLQIGQSWQKQYNYDFKPEDQIAIDQQGIVNPLHADFKILALLLQDLNDKAQKQLDGQYNIPEGATFWVPLTAAYYRKQGGDTGSGLQNMLDSLAVDQNTGATDQNTTAISQLTSATYESLESMRAQRTFPESTGGENFQKIQGRVQNIRIDKGVQPPDRRYDSIEDLRAGRTFQNQAPQQQSIFERLLSELRSIFGNPGQFPSPGRYGPAYDTTKIGGGSPTSLAQKTPSAPTNPSTKLDLRVNSNINLLVDGRILASTLQTYLASELLRTEQTQGTITRRYIA